jgi:hypothetical protein
MTSSELNQVTVVAKEACLAVIAHPYDRSLRGRLFDVLAPIVNLSFVGRQDGQSAHLYGLIRQVYVLSEFLRNRIDVTDSKAAVATSEIGGIESSANELRHKLDEMLAALDGDRK